MGKEVRPKMLRQAELVGRYSREAMLEGAQNKDLMGLGSNWVYPSQSQH